ncbi:Calcium-transporting ATPase 2 [Ceratocystis fimbriata CBS 114723]|uniref:Complex III subunit 9 n=1 Tax=Ceratocystis fimbriata CBS 114723 TaxID=1035309 RepID=A0A2C5XGE9_9PEZI|nr:Calcium-transporting ATPase 2 [Ceratocystis fimbriata CBS 114723]
MRNFRPEGSGVAMEGPEFRKLDEQKLRGIALKIQVLACSSPEDKRILVKTPKKLDETVVVTGNGTNDAPALKTADILFNEANNRGLNFQPSIFEGMSKNCFFLGMSSVMIGGQVLTTVKGDKASKNTALNGKELGLSAGFGAMSLPMGVAIQLFLEWFLTVIHAPYVDDGLASCRPLWSTLSTRKSSPIPPIDYLGPRLKCNCSLFSKNYLMLTTVFGAGFAFEIGFNRTMDNVWDNMNRGRQWKDIRHKFVEGGDEEE